MSLPHNGSTAPTITSPLLAWPSMPKARSPLLSPPEATSPVGGVGKNYPSPPNTRTPPSTTATQKGKERAGDDDVASGTEDLERNYGPPRQPLTPHQLSRIAQSFGIVIPSLPPPSPSPLQSPLFTASPDQQPLAGPSRLRHESRPSPHLLTVIPPLALLSLSATSADEAERRTRKWKRGRLIALQPTLGGMLVAIAREFGLPSTLGLQVYMRQSPTRRGMSDSSSMTSLSSLGYSNDDPAGPQVSTQTWSTLFAPYLHSTTASRASTPAHTPLKESGALGRDLAFPLSPLSLLSKPSTSSLPGQTLAASSLAPRGHTRLKSLTSEPSLPAAQASNFPLTPTTAPLANPVIGTIDFDVDLDQARWVGEYLRTGGRARTYSGEAGMRQLRLPRKVQASPISRHLRERNLNLARGLAGSSVNGGRSTRSTRSDDDIESGETTLNDHDDLSHPYNYAAVGHKGERDASPHLKHQGSVSRRLSVRRNGPSMRSTKGSFGEMDLDDGNESIELAGLAGNRSVPEIYLHEREYSGASSRITGRSEGLRMDEEEELHGDDEEGADELLASPIALDRLNMSAGTNYEAIKRGSAMVMSDQLDDLEKIMRQLSPRDIRLTSPRMLTPRMAAKVAHENLQLPAHPSARLAPPHALSQEHSSKHVKNVSQASTRSAQSDSSSGSAPLHPPAQTPAERSTLTVNTFGPASNSQTNQKPSSYASSSFDANSLTRPPLEAAYTDDDLRRPAWPAVPFAKFAESPGSPSSIHELFRQQQGMATSPISNETLTRMKLSPPRGHGAQESGEWTPGGVSEEWKPKRPNRPISPDLGDMSTLHHSLSPELVDHLRSPDRTLRKNGEASNQIQSPGLTSTQLDASPSTDEGKEGGKMKKPRSGNISLKGLKSMGSRNFGKRKTEVERPPALPLASSSHSKFPGQKEKGVVQAVGLFENPASPDNSSFPGLRSTSTRSVPTLVTGEFGTTHSPASPPIANSMLPDLSGSLPSRKDSHRSFSRWNPFGRKGSESPKTSGKSLKSTHSRHSPSIDQKAPSSFAPSHSIESYNTNDTTHFQRRHGTSPSLASVASRPAIGQMQSSNTMRTLSSVVSGDETAEGVCQGDREGPGTPARGTGGAGPHGTPGSPISSPHSVKRKPVPPPMAGRPSMGSLGGGQGQDGWEDGYTAPNIGGYEGAIGGRRDVMGLGIRTG